MTSLDTEETSRVVYDAKAQGSSSMMVRSDEEPNSSNRCEAGVTAEDLALVEFNSVEEAYASGYRNLHFIKKDLYNYIDDVRCFCIVEGDAAAAIIYLKRKTELDPLAVVQYSYYVENHLGNLFWCDGQMQHDYDCFGTNHHRQTIIFGFELLEDEKIPSYKWMLRCFMDVMRQKPMVVVTDGDESMKEAI
ncbi:hypothetical protein AHAS_Ahas18G0250600 [Arachis hypogaea]